MGGGGHFSIAASVTSLLCATAALPVTLPTRAAAQANPTITNVIPEGGNYSARGNVQAVDPAARTLTSMAGSNTPLPMTAAPGVNLADIEVDGTVSAHYSRSVAFFMANPQAGMSQRAGTDTVDRAAGAAGGIGPQATELTGAVTELNGPDSFDVVNASPGRRCARPTGDRPAAATGFRPMPGRASRRGGWAVEGRPDRPSSTAATGERSMSQDGGERVITRAQYDAVLFDLDGVITDTASLHAACWKQMFDEYLRKRAEQGGGDFRPFDPAEDYRLYVDGKPRSDGVRDFLRSRGIQLPEGVPDDPPQAETVSGLGNRKNELVNRAIKDTGVKPYDGSVELIRHLRRQGFKIAVATSSRNCDTVLRAAKLEAFFEVRVDGNTISAQGLSGKPAPDMFLTAARLLGADPKRTVVVEDAISGVQAGSSGNFGLVIGVARKGNADELRRNGAHVVVDDLRELVG